MSIGPERQICACRVGGDILLVVEDEEERTKGSWGVDPLGRHELRWRNVDGWTGWVDNSGHRRWDPMDSVVGHRPPTRLLDRRHAARRLAIGIVAVVGGVLLAIASLIQDDPPGGLYILFAGPFLWGGYEVARAVRFLIRGAEAGPTELTEPAPPPVGFADEMLILDELKSRGRISAESYNMAHRRLFVKYNMGLKPSPTNETDRTS